MDYFYNLGARHTSNRLLETRSLYSSFASPFPSKAVILLLLIILLLVLLFLVALLIPIKCGDFVLIVLCCVVIPFIFGDHLKEKY